MLMPTGPCSLELVPGRPKFPALRRLQYWADHNEPSSWSVVNERAFFSSLESLAELLLEVEIHLPKLHPAFETRERHFLDNKIGSFLIDRRIREHLHCVGDSSLVYELDFPIMYGSGHEFFKANFSATNNELEEKERRDWKNGVDVKRELLMIWELMIKLDKELGTGRGYCFTF